MDSSYIIVTDSTANLSKEWIDNNEMEILSLNYYVDGKEYKGYQKDNITNLEMFYSMMREKKEIVTSLANIVEAEKMFRDVLERGKDVYYIAFSSGLSGTFQAISMVLNDLREEYVDRKIYYTDSLSAALGEGLLVYYALENRKNGMDIESNYKWVEEHKLNICHWFTVDDLFFLKRGGRVSATTAVVGTALNIKPVLHVDNNGCLIPMGKVRGRKKSLDALVAHMSESVVDPENQIVFISHGDCRDDAEYVAKRVKEKIRVREIYIGILDPVIGAHSGPGTVALFFMGKER